MKNKILSLILSALLFSICICIPAFASGNAGVCAISGMFTLECDESYTGKNIEFLMNEEILSEETTDHLDIRFDYDDYDASFHSAYRSSLSIDGSAALYTKEMSVTLDLGDAYSGKEIFIFCIKSDFTTSGKVNAVRNGNKLTVNGEDFAEMADSIIVVMTSNQTIGNDTSSPVAPAIICAVIAIAAIAATVVLVKKRNSSDNIVK